MTQPLCRRLNQLSHTDLSTSNLKPALYAGVAWPRVRLQTPPNIFFLQFFRIFRLFLPTVSLAVDGFQFL